MWRKKEAASFKARTNVDELDIVGGDKLEGLIEVLHLLNTHLWVGDILADALVGDDLEQLEQGDTVLEA